MSHFKVSHLWTPGETCLHIKSNFVLIFMQKVKFNLTAEINDGVQRLRGDQKSQGWEHMNECVHS